MKKAMTFLLAAGLALGSAEGVSAVEIKASGMFDFAFESSNGIDGAASFMSGNDFRRNFGTERSSHHFGAVERLRLNFDFIMSESLSAHYGAQVGTFTWGGPAQGVWQGGNRNEGNGGALGTRAANIVTREAFLDWVLPGSDARIRMGQQWYRLPSYAINSPVLDDTATGITAWVPLDDNMALTALWIRALSGPRRGVGGMNENFPNLHDTYDLFGLNLKIHGEGFEVTPWAGLGLMGRDAYTVLGGEGVAMGALPVTGYYGVNRNGNTLNALWQPSRSTVWFAGIGGAITRWDPLRLALDFYYSASDNKHKATERSGWYVAGSAEYKTAYGVPTLKAWYASGDDGNLSNGSERPLTLSGAFNPGANIYFHGRYSIANTIYNADAGGTWGVSAQWNKASYMENLYHCLRVTWFQGTNSKKMPAQVNTLARNGMFFPVTPANYLTTKDSVLEVDFDTTYSIYRNLAAVLELGYAFQNFDGNVWRNVDGDKAQFSNAWRAALNFRYTF